MKNSLGEARRRTMLAIGRWMLMLLVVSVPAGEAHSAELVDDRQITIHAAADVNMRRAALIAHLWGADGFPTQRMPDAIATAEAMPVKGVDDLVERVDELRMDQAPGLQALAYHFIPRRPNGARVVVHHGHACTFDDDPAPDAGAGMQRTIKALLGEGYGVLAVFMPHKRPGDCTGGHDAMFEMQTTGNPMKFFVEPVAIGLNYLKTGSEAGRFPGYRTFHMVGLSGGGWTTTVYAAIDPTIRCSVPVAGTIPLYLRSRGSVGDREQTDAAFYRIAGYPDLYILGSYGAGRRQIQVLGRRDNCCFGEAQHDPTTTGMAYAEAMQEYATRVQTALKEIGDASFRLEIDETAPSHMISDHAIRDILLPALREAR